MEKFKAYLKKAPKIILWCVITYIALVLFFVTAVGLIYWAQGDFDRYWAMLLSL